MDSGKVGPVSLQPAVDSTAHTSSHEVLRMKCQIEWVDSLGHPTPDDNDAVALALAHEAIWAFPEGHPNNRIIGYAGVRKVFPICQAHLERVTPEISKCWTFVPLPCVPKGVVGLVWEWHFPRVETRARVDGGPWYTRATGGYEEAL